MIPPEPRFFGLAFLLVVLGGCSMTRPVGEWRNESFTGSVGHLLIIGVTVRAERRRAYEDQFVERLGKRGIAATPSHRLLTSSSEKLTREAVEKAVEGRDIDAVLVTRLVGVKQAEVVRVSTSQDRDRYYITYYDNAFRETTPAYYEDYRVLTLETRLYDTASREMIWQMQSETIDVSRPLELIAGQIELTIKTLAKRGLIAPRS